MKYYAIGDKAYIKIGDDSMTLEEVKKQAASKKLLSPGDEVREIDRDEFLAPMEVVPYEDIIGDLCKKSKPPVKKRKQ
jgi:hypothetical protein